MAEIKTLRAVQPMANRDQSFNGMFEIPTFDEILQLVRRKTEEEGRVIGVYPETKHPSFHRALNLPLEDKLLASLTRFGMNHRNAPVFIQSFEVSNLKYLRTRTQVKLVQLVDGDDVAVDGAVTLAAPFDKPFDFALANDPLTSVVADVHSLGLVVYPFTQRNEPFRLASNYEGNPVNEFVTLYELGVDGFFSDLTDTARVGRYMFLLKTYPEARDCLLAAKGGQQGKSALCRVIRGPKKDD